MKRYNRNQNYEPRTWKPETREDEVVVPVDTVPAFQAADEEEPERTKEVVEEPKKVFMAKVVNVDHLRIRQLPDINSGISGLLDRGSIVKIAGDAINDFYPIVTATGVDGFCASQFLLIYEEGNYEDL